VPFAMRYGHTRRAADLSSPLNYPAFWLKNAISASVTTGAVFDR